MHFVCLPILATGVIAPPSAFHGEATLSEIAGYLDQEYRIKVTIPSSIKDRPLFFHWAPQSETQVLTGLARSLDLEAKKDERSGIWEITTKTRRDAENARREFEEYIDAVMRFRLGLLDLTEVGLADLRRKASEEPGLAIDLLEPKASVNSFVMHEVERSTLSIIKQLGMLSFGSDFTRPFEPSNSYLIDPSGVKGISELFNQNWSVISPTEPIGEPIIILAPTISADLFKYELRAVYSNTQRLLGSIRIPHLKHKSRFAGSLDIPGHEVRVEPKPVYERSGRSSFEILPSIFKQLGKSFAVWCPITPQTGRWSRLPQKVSLNDLMKATIFPREHSDAPQLYEIAFEPVDGWTRIRHRNISQRLTSATTNWTKLLPFLRRLRTGQVDMSEMVQYASSLSEADAHGVSNAPLERADMSAVDHQFAQGIYLLKSLSFLADELEGLEVGNDARLSIAELPSQSKRSIEAYLKTARFWPRIAHVHHPQFPDRLQSYHLRVRKENAEDRLWLYVIIEELENEGAAVRLPLPVKKAN